ncbi:ArnT family glycosyltransferase [Piscinibacterium candidicorallinum]|jgi:4-amino-4-deoxy-L-arabinose transferase-like glycosyltransferase|uniref:ArnT family glycosyltransferase n=1 Tax=Piscinibacterium candidicorallinum TaxID=1793872 RepID=A0ABV7H5B2_9BURK
MVSPAALRKNPALLTERATRKLPRTILLAMVVAYCAAGLIGRDPWRTDDAVTFGVAWTMAHGNLLDWLMPNVLGDPVAQDGPLTYWLSALSIWLFGGMFGEPLAARIPTGLATGLAVAATWYATYTLARTRQAQPVQFLFGGAPEPRDYGRAIADGAVLTLLATLGLLLRLHEATPEALQFCLLCLAMYGLVVTLERPRAGAVWLGITLGALLLTRGQQAALPLGLVVLALAIFYRPMAPARRYLGLLTLPLALAPTALWLYLLREQGPQAQAYLQAWFKWNLAANSGQSSSVALYFARNLLIFGWPALPFALIAVWRWRQRLSAPHMMLPAAVVLTHLLYIMVISAEGQEALMVSVLPGSFILAAFLLPTLSRSTSNAIDWFALMSLSFGIFLVWLGYLAMQAGWPPTLSRNFTKLAPGWVPSFSVLAFILAVIATLFWAYTVWWRTAKKPIVVWRAMIISGVGVLTGWFLLTTLWMPWINHTRTYRDVALAMKAALPQQHLDECVSTQRLSLPQRAIFGYFAQLRLEPRAVGAPGQTKEDILGDGARNDAFVSPVPVSCQWLLTQDSLRALSESVFLPALPEGPKPGQWTLVWEGRRFSDRDERFRLYRLDARPDNGRTTR